MKKHLLFFTFCFLLTGAFCQPASTGNWLIYFGNKTINQRWNWHHEVQYRNYNFAGDLEQLLLRTGIGYNLSNNNNNLLLGYGFILSEPYIGNTDEKRTTREHRIYQQFITRQAFGRVNIQHRYRVEERFLEDEFKMRLRYFLSLNIPFNRNKMEAGAIYGSLYNEVFLNTQSPVFDRNRVYGALGYIISKKFRGELGFMTQMLPANHRNQLQIAVFGNY
jgi:hypothetical protein